MQEQRRRDGSGQTASAGADTFEDQLLVLLNQQPRRMVVPLMLSLLLIAGLASRTTPIGWVLAWFGFATILIFGRLLLQSDRLGFLPKRRRLRVIIVLVALSGVAHGSSLMFFPQMAQFERAVLSMMLVGMSAGAVATAIGYRPVFLAYIIPTQAPLAILWAVSPGLRDVGWIQGLMSVLIVMQVWILDALAKDTNKVMKTSFEIRMRNEELVRKMQAALDQAEAANRAKTRFLASASHDLRQPIQTLSLFAAALALRPLDARSREIAQDINAAVHDLTAELDALLDISKLDAGVVQPDFVMFQLQPFLQRIEDMYRPTARAKDLDLLCRCPADVWIRTDRKLMERLVRNLVDNAVKYTQSGRVTISVEAGADDVTLTIADTGVGIATAEHERVFEEFYQIDNPERDRKRGLGLGLAIVRRLATLLGVQLSMESEPRRGTAFHIAMRRAVGDEPALAQESEMSLRDVGPLRVLFIDDEEGARRGMTALLEESGSAIDLASSTEDAVRALDRAVPDVVIADFRLRGHDTGIRAIHALRAIRPSLPALLVTGETAPERLREAQETGIPILHKPVSPRALTQELWRLAGNKNVQTADRMGNDHDAPSRERGRAGS